MNKMLSDLKKYDVQIEPSVAREVAKLSARLQRKVRNILKELERDRAIGCPLGEGLKGFRVYRGGRFALVYREMGGERRVEAITVEPREDEVLK